MTTQLTVTLSDKVYKRIERMAELVGRDAAEVLALKVGEMLPPLKSEMDMRPVESLSDKEVLATADSMMDETLNARRSALVEKQKNLIELTDGEKAELEMLWDVYNVGQLRKAQAIVETIKRGLRTAPQP